MRAIIFYSNKVEVELLFIYSLILKFLLYNKIKNTSVGQKKILKKCWISFLEFKIPNSCSTLVLQLAEIAPCDHNVWQLQQIVCNPFPIHCFAVSSCYVGLKTSKTQYFVKNYFVQNKGWSCDHRDHYLEFSFEFTFC